MRIAVNARHLMKDRLEGIGTVTNEIMQRIARNHPEDEFDYYFDRKTDPGFIHGQNVKGHIFFPPTRLPLLIRYWFNYPVKRHLKKNKHDVFFSPDGFLPIGLPVPKVSIVHDIAFLRNPLHVTPRIRRFYEKWMPLYIREADHIITVSAFSKKELMAGYNLSEEKISVVYNGVSRGFHPIHENEKTEVREKYFNGHPFFIYLGAIHPRKNILTLVRAFELFKANTSSEHVLVIAGRPSWYTREVFKAVHESQVRDEIHMMGFVEADAAKKMIASAEALVYPSRYEGFGLPVVEAMASGTAVICSNVASLPEVAGEGALYFDPGNIDELATHLVSITMDRLMKEKLIAEGKERIKKFSWDSAAGEVYKILQSVAH
jgi:glycosyltransferase involved in cell wall biosynthesis